MEENAENCSLPSFFFLTFSSIIFFFLFSLSIYADSFVAISRREGGGEGDRYPWKIHVYRFRPLFTRGTIGRESLKLGMNLSGEMGDG